LIFTANFQQRQRRLESDAGGDYFSDEKENQMESGFLGSTTINIWNMQARIHDSIKT
jgi:hypothetical protein